VPAHLTLVHGNCPTFSRPPGCCSDRSWFLSGRFVTKSDRWPGYASEYAFVRRGDGPHRHAALIAGAPRTSDASRYEGNGMRNFDYSHRPGSNTKSADMVSSYDVTRLISI
jgi:hypothetical protein